MTLSGHVVLGCSFLWGGGRQKPFHTRPVPTEPSPGRDPAGRATHRQHNINVMAWLWSHSTAGFIAAFTDITSELILPERQTGAGFELGRSCSTQTELPDSGYSDGGVDWLCAFINTMTVLKKSLSKLNGNKTPWSDCRDSKAHPNNQVRIAHYRNCSLY